MHQTGRRDRFSAETLPEVRVRGQVGQQHLDGDRAAQNFIAALPNLRHPALRQRPNQTVPPCQGAWHTRRYSCHVPQG